MDCDLLLWVIVFIIAAERKPEHSDVPTPEWEDDCQTASRKTEGAGSKTTETRKV